MDTTPSTELTTSSSDTERQSNSSSSSDTQAFSTSSTHTETPPTSNTDSTPIPITSSTQFPNTRYNCRRCRLVGISYRKLLDRYNTVRQENRDYKKELNKNSRKRLNATIKRQRATIAIGILPLQTELNNTKKRLKRSRRAYLAEVQLRRKENNAARDANLQHEVEIDIMTEKIKESAEPTPKTTKNGKSYATQMRLLVYQMLQCNTPTSQIPQLLSTVYHSFNSEVQSIPVRSTVERMALELGILSDHIVST